jgi:UDP-N-acetylmuramoylalanine--D-glutamate ligase
MKYVNEKLQEFEKFICNKTVAIIGLEKSNLPLLDYFYDKGANITVFDNRVIDEIDKDILDKITDRCIRFSFGEHNLINLVGYEIIFRGPSCRPDLPEIKAEQLRGAVVTSEIELILEMAPCRIIGVTGSSGAETTAKLIYSILKENGNDCYLGGNIGNPLLTELENMDRKSIIVLQANNMQLAEIQSSPSIAVITSLEVEEKVPTIEGIVEDESKNYTENIFKYQKECDITILNYDIDLKKNFIEDIPGKIKYFSSSEKLDNGIVCDNGIVKRCEDGVRRHMLTIDDAISVDDECKNECICAAIAATTGIVEPNMQIRAIIKYRED